MAKRRGHSEGSICLRQDGRWMARVDLGWRAGKRQRKAVYGRTRREVADRLAGLQQAARNGQIILDERLTVAAFLEYWLEHKRAQLRPRAWQTYEQAVRLHLTPGIGKVALTKLSPAQLDTWFRDHQAATGSARTIRYARTVLRAALGQARKWRLVTENVATLIDAPRHTPKEIQPLSPTEARTLLDVSAGHRLGALVSVAVAVGLRQGEMLGLRWADVDLDAGVLRVRQALERSGGDPAQRRVLSVQRRALQARLRALPADSSDRAAVLADLARVRDDWRAVRSTLRITEPKSTRSRRTIRMPAVVIAALKTHRVAQLRERLAAGAGWTESGLVFVSPVGRPLDPRWVSRAFADILRGAGLRHCRLHDLRHTSATLLLAQGVDPRTIMETLGHSQISLTLNTYSHVLPALQADAAAKMDAILAGR